MNLDVAWKQSGKEAMENIFMIMLLEYFSITAHISLVLLIEGSKNMFILTLNNPIQENSDCCKAKLLQVCPCSRDLTLDELFLILKMDR